MIFQTRYERSRRKGRNHSPTPITSSAERDRAWKNILKAAKHFGVDVEETDRRRLVKHA